MLYAIIALGGPGLVSETLRRAIDAAWMKLAWLLGLVVPKIVLTLVFFLVLCPLAFIARLFKKQDPLFLSRGSNSTFLKLSKTFGPADLENPW